MSTEITLSCLAPNNHVSYKGKDITAVCTNDGWRYKDDKNTLNDKPTPCVPVCPKLVNEDLSSYNRKLDPSNPIATTE